MDEVQSAQPQQPIPGGTPQTDGSVNINLTQSQVRPRPNILARMLRALQLKNLKGANRLIVIGIVLVLLLASGVVVTYAYIQLSANNSLISKDGKLLSENNGANGEMFEDPAPREIRDQENPINGELYTKTEMKELSKRPPLAIVVDNHVAARPQSSLNKADIVYEMLVESGITRFVGVYWGEQADEVGPVRSLRRYMVDITNEYDAAVKHIGWASETGLAETDAESYVYDTDAKSFLWGGYQYRTTDREAPHNAYTTTSRLWEQAEDKGWGTDTIEVSSLKFKNDATVEDRPATSVVDVAFRRSSPDYNVKWSYNKDTNSYLRSNGGNEAVDKVTGLRLETKNIVVQSIVTEYPREDDKHRASMNMIGEGEVVIFRDGLVFEGKWKKQNTSDRTRYYDVNGNEIELNRGKIWVELFPVDEDGDPEGTLNYN